MSQLDDAWSNIQGWLADATRPKPDFEHFSPEYAQAMSRFMHGISTVREDVNYFLDNAPLGDARRSAVLRVKEILNRQGG